MVAWKRPQNKTSWKGKRYFFVTGIQSEIFPPSHAPGPAEQPQEVHVRMWHGAQGTAPAEPSLHVLDLS